AARAATGSTPATARTRSPPAPATTTSGPTTATAASTAAPARTPCACASAHPSTSVAASASRTSAASDPDPAAAATSPANDRAPERNDGQDERAPVTSSTPRAEERTRDVPAQELPQPIGGVLRRSRFRRGDLCAALGGVCTGTRARRKRRAAHGGPPGDLDRARHVVTRGLIADERQC